MVTPRLQERHTEGSRRQMRSGTLAAKTKKAARKRGKAQTTRRTSAEREATKKDVQHMLGKLDSADIANILQPQPTVAELEEAIMWSRGDAYLLGRRPLMGNAAIVYDILTAGRDGPGTTH